MWLAAAGAASIMAFAGFIEGKVALDKGHMAYEFRPGGGTGLILIPGSFSDARQWDEVVPALPASLPLLLVELRGHGRSWPPPEDGSIGQFAQDVLKAAAQVGWNCFYVGGHSIGGMVALEIGRIRPQQVKGVCSLEGWTDHRAAEDAFQGAMRNTLTPELERKRLESRARVTSRWTEQQRTSFARIWRRWSGLEFLRTTGLPVLEIYGDRGRPRPTLGQLWIPDRANIQVRWIAGASHSLPLERPREVAAAMAEFIAQIERSTAGRWAAPRR